MGANVSLVGGIAKTTGTTVLVEVAMTLGIARATWASERVGEDVRGTYAAASGSASSSEEATAPAQLSVRAMTSG